MLGAGLTAVCCFALLLLVMKGAGIRPFGTRSNILGDDGAQYIHFYAAFREALTSHSLSSLQFSWAFGAGVPFLPTYATYLGGPFTFLVLLFPPSRVGTAISAIVLTKLITSSAVMFALLRTLGPRRHPGIAVFLATAYAVSGWVFDVGWFNPQWLDGLIAFPALSLVALRCRNPRRHLWPGILVVALFWWSNFYSAYMASVGAAIVLAVVEMATSTTLRRSALRIGRFALTGVLGVVVTSPTLVPTLVALRHGSPTGGSDMSPLNWSSIIVRALPLTEGVAYTPGLFSTSAALILALGIPAAMHLPWRTRLSITIAAVVVLLSLNIPVMRIAWNAFNAPHGMPFRFTFVVCGLIVVTAHAAWPPLHGRHDRSAHVSPRTTISAITRPTTWPGLLSWACSAVFFTLIATTVTAEHEKWLFVRPDAAAPGWRLLTMGALTSAIITFSARSERRAWRVATAVVLAAASLAGTALSAAETVATGRYMNDNIRKWAAELLPVASTDRARLREVAQLTAKAGWPVHRVNARVAEDDAVSARPNASGRYSFPGLGYYSTTVEASTARPLIGLGYIEINGGRTLYNPDDQVLVSLLAAYDPTSRFAPLPMVRKVTDADPAPGLPTDLANRERLLGTRMYSSPDLTLRTDYETRALPDRKYIPSGQSMDIGITCPAGHYVVTHLNFRGTARLMLPNGGSTGPIARSNTSAGQTRVQNQALLTRSSGSPTWVRLSANAGGTRSDTVVPAHALVCMDPKPLQQRIAAAAPPSSLAIGPSKVDARFEAPQTGTIVVATTANDGWTCRVDGRRTELAPLAGMLAVSVTGAHQIDCGYRTPGLDVGVAIGIATLLATALITIAQGRRARRSEES
ncbi:YfhO family protein [Acidipropionibacterium acidipropionici]|uniref:YfhO family protein n=1 Tax=Acidipropionibacterium acidipropionici TaxID=1748 RepID=UPI000565DB57|nr:YfhO family protein [Acidipropionibacterium acidipropionici]ALN14300.1 hypothetical protein ASQ49_02385 [Acidipropionibacterium acidipropionici]APZ09939.1 hypothetical protein BWX38_12565 [Acidipropionibacterium acidipropionici]